MNERKNKEKGSITLYVLVACVFFSIVLALTYVKLVYKSQGVEENLEQIQNNYAQKEEEDLSEQDMNVTIQYKDPSLNNTWVKEITLVGSAEKKEGTERNIAFYAFVEEGQNINDIVWTEAADDETSNITKEIVIKENGIYRFYVKNDNEEISKSDRITVANIDNEKPTPGTINAIELDPDDNITELGKYSFGKWTSYNVYVEKVDGTDAESGHKSSKMTILKNSLTVPEWQDIDGPVILTEIGTYTVTVTTEDNLGNIATSEKYYILIDKNVPTLVLKYTDENGEDYNGEWTNQDVYGHLTIDTSESGKTVQKYQYSQNGYTWTDMMDLSGFDYISFIEAMLKTIYKGNENYYFELDENAGIKANNTNINNSNAQGYFIIDLTDYTWLNVLVSITAKVSSEENHDFGYVDITESEEPIDFDANNDYWIKISGEETAEEYKLLSGGKKYFVHFGYYKDDNTSLGTDTFSVSPIIVPAYFIYFADYNKKGNDVTFRYTLEGYADTLYFRAVYDEETQDYSKKSSSYPMRIDKTAPVVETQLIANEDRVDVEVNVTEELSGIKQIYLSKDSTPPTEDSNWSIQISKNFTLNNLDMDTVYYLWVQDEAGNISEVNTFETQINYTIDEDKYTTNLQQAIEMASTEYTSTIKLLNTYTDKSKVVVDKDIILDLQNFALTRESDIAINEDINFEITGEENSKITTNEAQTNTITNKGKLTINGNVIIENLSKLEENRVILNDHEKAIININDNVWVRGYYYGIYNNNGTVNINGGKVEAQYTESSARGIYNYSPTAVVNINGGEVLGYYGIYNNAIVEMKDGKVVGMYGDGIHSIGITNVYGGRIEGKAFGIYAIQSDQITIGNQTDILTNTSPVIYGETYGVRMAEDTNTFNFYNGTIMSKSKTTTYNGIINPRTGYMPYTYLNSDNYYCTGLTETVDNIEITADNIEYTKDSVNVRIKYPYISTNTKQYSEDGSTWINTNDYYLGVHVTENKIIYARTLNEEGTVIEEKQIEISNIDTEKPIVTIESEQNSFIVSKPNETIDLKVTISAQDPGVSGLSIAQYAWVKDGQNANYIDFTGTLELNQTQLTYGVYTLYVRARDNAGNETQSTQVYTISLDDKAPEINIESAQNSFIVSRPDETVNINARISVEDIGVSGLNKAQYAWVKDGESINYIDFTGTIELNKTQLSVGTYTLYVKAIDNVGNESETKQEYTVTLKPQVENTESTESTSTN